MKGQQYIHFSLIKVLLIVPMIFICGCSPVEVVKTVWGSSTRALEKARETALTRTYDQKYWDTVRHSIEAIDKFGWTVFMKDETKGYLVVMRVPGAVDTTEIGIFFVEVSENETRVEIASLSTSAKRIVARQLFNALDLSFSKDPELK